MSVAKFLATPDEFKTVYAIAKRAHELAASFDFDYSVMDAEMDVIAAHANGCPLDLCELLAADDANFGHDVFGIRRHIDRDTGTLGDCFVPRCARRAA